MRRNDIPSDQFPTGASSEMVLCKTLLECAPRIVLYEDDDALAAEIVLAFGRQGYAVAIAESEEELVREARNNPQSILILDRMVHGTDSLQVIQRLRQTAIATPAIVISSMTSVDDRIGGLEAGGDDYLTKPFAMGELMARVEALRRRATSTEARETRLTVGDLTMDLIDRTVQRGNRPVTLLPREFTLLEFFMRRPDQIITRAMMLEGVWKYRAPMITNVVDVHMSNLRRKIDQVGETPHFRNQRGVGFILS